MRIGSCPLSATRRSWCGMAGRNKTQDACNAAADGVSPGAQVLFHEMARKVASFWPLSFDTSRSQSRLRVATTAAPVSAADLYNTWVRRRSAHPTQPHPATPSPRALGRSRLTAGRLMSADGGHLHGRCVRPPVEDGQHVGQQRPLRRWRWGAHAFLRVDSLIPSVFPSLSDADLSVIV